MDDLQSEKEQLEEMRAWWSEYGKMVIAGIAIGIAGFVGYNQYSASQYATQVEASERYEELVAAMLLMASSTRQNLLRMTWLQIMQTRCIQRSRNWRWHVSTWIRIVIRMQPIHCRVCWR